DHLAPDGKSARRHGQSLPRIQTGVDHHGLARLVLSRKAQRQILVAFVVPPQARRECIDVHLSISDVVQGGDTILIGSVAVEMTEGGRERARGSNMAAWAAALAASGIVSYMPWFQSRLRSWRTRALPTLGATISIPST